MIPPMISNANKRQTAKKMNKNFERPLLLEPLSTIPYPINANMSDSAIRIPPGSVDDFFFLFQKLFFVSGSFVSSFLVISCISNS